MHLKSLTLKGFKSFPERTRLDFGPGVSVVVGPNGSGKSNITDAVLWAMGEQSPLAVRGQSMQDVIFGGAPGVQARSAAEVELVLDNADGTVDVPFSEISIVRELARTGEGTYRLNGARCRLTDVIEALSDTGLGKETHSIISQGRVEEIVTSKPRDRRLLIEEAAGLGKHRKRRRRAQLKLERTQENLDRALDVEREARTRLRPLKRQAEAAELHARLERQTREARLELVRDDVRGRALELREAEQEVAAARRAREEVESALQEVSGQRAAAERALSERSQRRDALAGRVYATRAAGERLQLRAEQARHGARALAARSARTEHELRELGERPADGESAGDEEHRGDRIAALQREVTEIESERQAELRRELEELEAQAARQGSRVQELERERDSAREDHARGERLLAEARAGSAWSTTWDEVRRVLLEGAKRIAAAVDEAARELAAREISAQAERLARELVDYELQGVRAAEQRREQQQAALAQAERALAEAGEEQRRTQWLIEQRRAASEQGSLALRRAALEGELGAERRQLAEIASARARRLARIERLRVDQAAAAGLLPLAERLASAIDGAREATLQRLAELEAELASDSAAGEQMAAELRACAGREAEIQARLRGASEAVTTAEVAAQRLRDRAAEAETELRGIIARLGRGQPARSEVEDRDEDGRAAPPAAGDSAGPGEAGVTDALAQEALSEEQRQAVGERLERLARRREQLGPVNPLARSEYEEAVAHVEEMEARRADLEGAMRELRAMIADTDRHIQRSFEATFQAAADNFELLAGDLFPGGSGRLRLVRESFGPRPVLGGAEAPEDESAEQDGSQAERDAGASAEAEPEARAASSEDDSELAQLGVEIEVTPAGKSTRRLTLLSGGEKSMTALAFLFAVFLARPCPFYILDEVEAALDDLNLDRFLALLRRYSERAQFIVITHQKRTMEAADWLYGVSMGADGVSKVLSRRLPGEQAGLGEVAEVA